MTSIACFHAILSVHKAVTTICILLQPYYTTLLL